MSDVSQFRAFELRADLADPDAEFDYDVQIGLPDGSAYKVGEALFEGDGVIVTDDRQKIDSLESWGATKSVAVPDDFTPPADPRDSGPSLTDLKARASELDIDGRSSMNKDDLIAAIETAEAEASEPADDSGGDGAAPDDDKGTEG